MLVPSFVPLDASISIPSDSGFQVFAALQWILLLLIAGLILSRYVKIDNFVLLLVVIFGLGSVIIHTVIGAAIGKWGRGSVALMGASYWWIPWIAVGILVIASLFGIRSNRKSDDENKKWPYVILTILGLALLTTKIGFEFASGVSYVLQWLLIWFYNLIGWPSSFGAKPPWK